MVSWREREARNEARFRTQNEWVETAGSALGANHENPESEAVVQECARYAVIDKIEGWGLRVSRETDPRSSSGSRLGTPA